MEKANYINGMQIRGDGSLQQRMDGGDWIDEEQTVSKMLKWFYMIEWYIQGIKHLTKYIELHHTKSKP